MTELVKFTGTGTGLISRSDLAAALNNRDMVAPRVGGDKQFLKMGKDGVWVYGQEETVVEDDSLWAVNPASFEYGYIAWSDKAEVEGEVEGEVMVPILRPLPATGTLRTKDGGNATGKNGWQFQQSVDLVCIQGEDAGTTCQYKASSTGATKLFKALTDAIGGQINKGSDAIVPIIEMKSDSYKHKTYGKIFNPIFEIKEWRTMDDNSAPAAETKAAAPAPEPVQPDDDLEAALATEYEHAAAEAAQTTPRRRVRR